MADGHWKVICPLCRALEGCRELFVITWPMLRFIEGIGSGSATYLSSTRKSKGQECPTQVAVIIARMLFMKNGRDSTSVRASDKAQQPVCLPRGRIRGRSAQIRPLSSLPECCLWKVGRNCASVRALHKAQQPILLPKWRLRGRSAQIRSLSSLPECSASRCKTGQRNKGCQGRRQGLLVMLVLV